MGIFWLGKNFSGKILQLPCRIIISNMAAYINKNSGKEIAYDKHGGF